MQQQRRRRYPGDPWRVRLGFCITSAMMSFFHVCTVVSKKRQGPEFGHGLDIDGSPTRSATDELPFRIAQM
jgi:hypothetical protein